MTGGSGFIGRAVVAALQGRGAQVTIVDLVEPAVRDRGTDVIIGDLCDPAVREAAITPGTSGIVHLAAITSVLKSVELPAETYAINVDATAGLLDLCRRHDVPRFLLASTNAVVGDVGDTTIRTDQPLQPLTPYGATKAAGEMLLAGYAGSYGLAAAALRFTNVYGPGMSHKDSFVPRMMKAALSGDTIKIYGDGQQRRDLVHLDDVVAGLLLAWDRRFSGRAILGGGRSVSVLDMVAACREATGCELPVEHVPAPPGEMPAVVVDLAGSERDLGYRPTIDLTTGLAQVWQDFRGEPLPAR